MKINKYLIMDLFSASLSLSVAEIKLNLVSLFDSKKFSNKFVVVGRKL